MHLRSSKTLFPSAGLAGVLRTCALLLCLTGMLPTASAQTKQVLTFSTLENIRNSRLGLAVLTRVYEELGIGFEVRFLDSKRALVLSSTGVTDGEVVRIKSVGDKYPSLIRIDIPIAYLNAAVYVRTDVGAAVSLETLPDQRVGRMPGVVFAEKFTSDFKDVWLAETHEQLFSLLASGKLDAVVSSVFAGKRTISKLGLDNVATLGDAFRAEPLFHYVHEKHRPLAQRLEKTLKEMKERGELDELM